jgi:hypothetical protein
MSGERGSRLTRRALCCVLASAALSVSTSRIALAQDPAGALRDLGESPDFRVRLSAALYLGRYKPPGAREALERALGDAHSAVRVAVAAALGALGDPAALAALSRRMQSEPSASVRAQIQSTIDRLHQGVAADQAPPDGARHTLAANVRYLVKLGTMRNPSGVRGDELRLVLHAAVRSRAHGIHGAVVVDGADPTLLAQAAERRLPILTLDGSLMALTESRVADSVQVQARVEFAVRREQTLRGTLSGAATTFGSSPTLTDQGRRALQDDAVDGAVQSALRGADQGLVAAL